MTNNFLIESPGEYMTRDGRKAIVLAISPHGCEGYIKDDAPFSWTLSGLAFDTPSRYDIVDVWKPHALDIYLARAA